MRPRRSTASRRRIAGVSAGLLVAALTGCGSGPQPVTPPAAGATSPATSATSATSTPASSWENPAIDGTFPAGPEKVDLTIRCWGSGSPVIVMEGGSGEGGLHRWGNNRVTEALASKTMVCAYDRAGVGESGPAPEHRRHIDDVVRDLRSLLTAADVPGPYLMAGVSGGGFYAFHFAGRYPDDVAGLVLIDTPPGQATMSSRDVEELAWDAPGNTEHVDYVAVEHQMAVARLPIPAVPVTVVTGSSGQSADDPRSQKVWLRGADPGSQVILDTGHEVDFDDPTGLSEAVLHVLELARG